MSDKELIVVFFTVYLVGRIYCIVLLCNGSDYDCILTVIVTVQWWHGDCMIFDPVIGDCNCI
jgi:hypothetical protein